jgi:hypothetical protein
MQSINQIMLTRLTACLVFGLLTSALIPNALAQDDKLLTAKRIEIDAANYLLVKFENYVGGLDGKEGTLTPDGKNALTKIATLKKQHPEDPRVLNLYERAQSAARLLRGDRIEITQDILAYRDIEKKRVEMLAGLSRKVWLQYQEKLLREREDVITNPFPAPNPENTQASEMKNRPIILRGLQYPEGVFLQYGRQFVAIGNAAKGFYFIDTSSQSFVGAYEAVRRYQRQVASALPKEWIVSGQITSPQIMAPGGGGLQDGQAYAGWLVEVDTIFVPENVFAQANKKSELGGNFAGEQTLNEAFASLYSVNKLPPADSAPEDLLKVFVTAIKEKNFDLYKQCIHPEEQQTAIQREWIARKWDIFQRRFTKDMVEVLIGKIDEIDVIQGGSQKENENILAEFLPDEEVKEVTNDGLPRSELVTLWLKLYDETGRMREYQKPITLKRDEKIGEFRWFVYSGFPF